MPPTWLNRLPLGAWIFIGVVGFFSLVLVLKPKDSEHEIYVALYQGGMWAIGKCDEKFPFSGMKRYAGDQPQLI